MTTKANRTNRVSIVCLIDSKVVVKIQKWKLENQNKSLSPMVNSYLKEFLKNEELKNEVKSGGTD